MGILAAQKTWDHLTEQQQAAIEHYLNGESRANAYHLAGYKSKSESVLLAASSRFFAKYRHVIRERREYYGRQARLSKAAWLAELERDICNPELDPQDRHRAGALWARATGYDYPEAVKESSVLPITPITLTIGGKRILPPPVDPALFLPRAASADAGLESEAEPVEVNADGRARR